MNTTDNLDLSMESSLSFTTQTHLGSFTNECPLGIEETQPADGTIPLNELKAMLQQQLEYYFSRENLASDTYLLSQMDSDQYVPIGTVANFNQIKRLTKDLDLIVEVLRASPNVQVDASGKKVRPNHKRCVLILREIAETTPVKEIEDLFKSESCPKFTSCEFAHNNSWYVTFESDEDAQQAYRYLREEVKTFQGRPIMARIKAKSITRASFISSYKNGYRQPNEMAYSPLQNQQPQPQQSQHQQQQQQQQQQPQPQQQQPQPSQQQAQQSQQRYSYSNVPTVSYNSQQVFPPFYPPAMLQAWAPTTPACFDLGTVFTMNGLAPQAAFKPINSNSRHHFHANRKGPKSYNRNHQNYEGNSEQCTRLYDRGQSSSYLHRQQHSSHGLLNGSTSGFGYVPYGYGTRTPYGFGMDMQDFFNSSYSKRLDIHSSIYSNYNNSQFPNGSQSSGGKSKGENSSPLLVGGGGAGPKEDASQDKGSEFHLQEVGQPQRYNYMNRIRRRRKEEVDGTLKMDGSDCGSKSPSAKDVKPESQQFDLAAAAFPPLPGSVEEDILDSDVFENRLSDVVKGTARPSMRDSKTQTSESSMSSATVSIKDSSTLTNGEMPPIVLTPPASPIALDEVQSDVAVFTSHEATSTVETTEEEVDSPPHSPLFSACDNARTACAVPNDSAATGASSGATSSTASSTCASPLPASDSYTDSIEFHSTLNRVAEKDAFPQIQDEKVDKLSRRLTYSEVAQRAKEKVEKIALELKEKERQEARHAKQQEIQSQTKPPIPTTRVLREFPKGKTTEQQQQPPQQPRFGYNKEAKERRTGPIPLNERERFRRYANRSPRGDQKEERPASVKLAK